MIELVIASRNRKKVKEIKEILKGLNLKVTALYDYPGAPYINENGKTFRENAIKKARKIARFSGKLTLGEDSGLEVKALNNKPGIHSSRFSGRKKNDRENNLKLLRLLEGLPQSRRKARYFCSVALADKSGLLGVAEGACYGVIGYQLRGSSGFGYDPLFIIPKYNKTCAQLGLKIKHKISHRFRALTQVSKLIQKYCREIF